MVVQPQGFRPRNYGTYVVCEGNGEVDKPASAYYMRVSSQVYLDLNDFEWLGNAVLAILRTS